MANTAQLKSTIATSDSLSLSAGRVGSGVADCVLGRRGNISLVRVEQ